jgi:hypothetical protein
VVFVVSSGRSILKVTSMDPNRIRDPLPSGVTTVIGTSFTYVPFLLPRSSTLAESPWTTMRA